MSKPASVRRRNLLVAIMCLVFVINGIVVVKHMASRQAALAVANQPAAVYDTYDPRIAAPGKTYNLEVTNRTITSGPRTITVKRGDSVHIVITYKGSGRNQSQPGRLQYYQRS